jgi:aquaporin Z
MPGNTMLRPYLAEFMGTAVLCLVGCGAITIGQYGGDLPLGLLPVGLAFGIAAGAMFHAVGPVSGGHFNPAVTVAMMVAGRLPAAQVPGYLLAQVLGALAGCGFLALILSFRVGGYNIAAAGLGETMWNPIGGFEVGGAMLGELVATFILVTVFLGVTRSGPSAGAGLSIGLTIAILHLTFVPVSGASMNPARSLAPAIFVAGPTLAQVWLYLLVPTLAGVLAGLMFRFRLFAAD